MGVPLKLLKVIRVQKKNLNQFRNFNIFKGRDQKYTKQQLQDDDFQFLVIREEIKILKQKIKELIFVLNDKGTIYFKSQGNKTKTLFNERLEQTILILRQLCLILCDFEGDNTEIYKQIGDNVYDEQWTFIDNIEKLNKFLFHLSKVFKEYDQKLKYDERQPLGMEQNKKIYDLIFKAKFNAIGMVEEFQFFENNSKELFQWIKKMNRNEYFKDVVRQVSLTNKRNRIFQLIDRKIKQFDRAKVLKLNMKERQPVNQFVLQKLNKFTTNPRGKYAVQGHMNIYDNDDMIDFQEYNYRYNNISNIYQYKSLDFQPSKKSKLIPQKPKEPKPKKEFNNRIKFLKQSKPQQTDKEKGKFKSRNYIACSVDLSSIEKQEVKQAYKIGLGLCKDSVVNAIKSSILY